MEFKLTINCDNDAFAPAGDGQVSEGTRSLIAVMLRDVAKHVENGGVVIPRKLYDPNGNSVGWAGFGDEPEIVWIHVAHVESEEDNEFFAAGSEEELTCKLAEYCATHWETCPEGHITMPKNEQERVRLYFEGHENDTLTRDVCRA